MSNLQTEHFRLDVYEAGAEDARQLALILPGRLESKDYVHIISLVDSLASRGYHAVTFDPPGSWGSEDTADYTVTNYLQAVNELITYYGNLPTLLVGHSLGGSIALQVAATNPQVIGCVSLMAGISDKEPDPEWQQQGYVTFKRDLPPGDRPDLEQKSFDLPYSYYEDRMRFDIREALKTCQKPKLFVAGLHDRQMAPEVAQATYDLAVEPKQLVMLPMSHGYRYNPKWIRKIDQLVGDFAAKLVG